MRRIYLDNNATTPIADSVREALAPFLREHYGNPSSSHPLGRACHEAVEDARSRVAQLIGATADEIVFTSGGSESNNLALKGVALAAWPARGHILISALEHPTVSEPARHLQRLGFEVSTIACDAQGRIDPADVRRAIRHDTLLLSVMHSNNEIGSVQAIGEIAKLCRAQGVLVHTDAAQSVGKLSVRADELDVDLLTLAGHKLYAPKGIGALYVRRGVSLEPLLHGAGQESGVRSGTENVAGIVALGEAARLANICQPADAGRIADLRERLADRLFDALHPAQPINAPTAERLPNTLSVNFCHVAGADLLRRAPEVHAATGAACHSSATPLSATLKAIGLSPEIGRGTVRLSLGRYTTEDEIDAAASLLVAAWEAMV
jgi:cysteine desulfurase